MASTPTLKITKTPRGFTQVEFKDTYGVSCSLQKSSLVSPSIWLGTMPKTYIHWLSPDMSKYEELPLSKEMSIATRMHLSQKEVIALLPLLEHFAQTGDLLNPES